MKVKVLILSLLFIFINSISIAEVTEDMKRRAKEAGVIIERDHDVKRVYLSNDILARDTHKNMQVAFRYAQINDQKTAAELTLISANSKFDKYLRGEAQLTASELGGYAIFNTEKGDCFHCHGTQMFMDNLFHNNGLDEEPFTDLGLGKITNDASDNGKFKTPTLRNIEFSAPYMHDGRFRTLEEVVEHYNSGGEYSSTVDPLMKKLGVGLQLTNQEKQDLVAFLKTLSDSDFIDK